MKSPEITTPTVEEKTEHLQQVNDLEMRIEAIEEWQKMLKTALDNNDVEAQRIATGKLQEELAEAKKLQARLEGKIENPESMLSIDRTINLVDDFLKAPRDKGGLGIDWLHEDNPIDEAESDPRNKTLTEIDLYKVKLDVSWLPEGKSSLGGQERLETLKSEKDVIRLDLYTLASLWKLFKGTEEQKKEFENKLTVIAEANGLKFEDLKKKAIFFDGTIVRDSGGDRCALYLRWHGSEWDWLSSGLGSDWDASHPSLVLAS